MELGSTVASIGVVMLGCILNNVELEFIISKKINWSDPSAGNVLTLLQFAFIAFVSLPVVVRWRGVRDDVGKAQMPFALRPTVVPVREYVNMTAYFSVMMFLNNIAFAFHISQPLHMVFRSSNLMVSYAYGWYTGKTKHDPVKLGSVSLLTMGAVLATFAETTVGDTAAAVTSMKCDNCGSATGLPSPAASASAAAGQLYFLQWCGGIAILSMVLVLQTLLGARQDVASKQYGKAPWEALFYMHALSLPVLAVLGAAKAPVSLARWASSPRTDTVLSQLTAGAGEGTWGQGVGGALLWLTGVAARVGLPVGSVPILWLHVLLNVATQWLCLAGVYSLISQADQLTVNVTLTVRKFVSLMASIALFGNTFTGWHWIGAVLVFGGAMMYGFGEQMYTWLGWKANAAGARGRPMVYGGSKGVWSGEKEEKGGVDVEDSPMASTGAASMPVTPRATKAARAVPSSGSSESTTTTPSTVGGVPQSPGRGGRGAKGHRASSSSAAGRSLAGMTVPKRAGSSGRKRV